MSKSHKRINPDDSSAVLAEKLVEGLMQAQLPDDIREKAQAWFKSGVSEECKYEAVKGVFEGLEELAQHDEYVERCLAEQHGRLGFPFGNTKKSEKKWWGRRTFSRSVMLRVAAVLAPVFIIYGTFLFMNNNESSADTLEISLNTVIAEENFGKDITLPDNTTIALADGAMVRYPDDFTRNREVYIEGEAFFSVTHDPDKPFIVHTNSITVTVYGTEFHVKAYADMPTAEVKLAAGSVAVTADGIDETMMVPGQHFVYDRSHRTVTMDVIGEGEILRLLKHGLLLDGNSFDEALTMMSQYFGTQFRIDPRIDLTERFAVSFEDDVKLDEALTLLQIISKSNFDYKIENDMVTITKRRSSNE